MLADEARLTGNLDLFLSTYTIVSSRIWAPWQLGRPFASRLCRVTPCSVKLQLLPTSRDFPWEACRNDRNPIPIHYLRSPACRVALPQNPKRKTRVGPQ